MARKTSKSAASSLRSHTSHTARDAQATRADHQVPFRVTLDHELLQEILARQDTVIGRLREHVEAGLPPTPEEIEARLLMGSAPSPAAPSPAAPSPVAPTPAVPPPSAGASVVGPVADSRSWWQRMGFRDWQEALLSIAVSVIFVVDLTRIVLAHALAQG